MSESGWMFYKGKRIYYRLKDVINHEDNIFSVDRGQSRFFICFNSMSLFEDWYVHLSPNERTINEVITSDTRKLIIDIDTPSDKELNNLLQMYDWVNHVTSRIKDVFSMLDIGKPNVIVYSMCDDFGKLSYHVVVSNFAFSAQTCLGLCLIISDRQVWESCVDTGIYKRLQCIRVDMSTKFGENRWKHCVSRPKASLRDGLLSYTLNTEFSDISCNVSRKATNTLFCDIPLSTLDILCSEEVKKQFVVRKICNIKKTVFLRRTNPGFCVQCNRVHSRENAIFRYVEGTYQFVCWRFLYK